MKLLLLLLLFSQRTYAYPEMIKHNYQSCTACHFSPSGGGILNSYGKVISKELLPTINLYKEDPDEEEKWFHIAGKSRNIQLNQENDIMKSKAFIPMQLDLETAAVIKNWVITTTAGLYKPRGKSESESVLISRRHYVMYRGENFNIRAGRFYPTFGILTPDHSKLVKRSIGFDQGRETYNVEASYVYETYEFALAGIIARATQEDIYSSEGYTLSISKNLGDSYKVGIHNMNIKDINIERQATSLTGSLGITEKLYIMSENIKQIVTSGSTKTNALIMNQVISYEVYKGITPYLGYELEDSKNDKTEARYTGLNFYPINHLELKLEFQKRKIIKPTVSNETWSFLQIYAYF